MPLLSFLHKKSKQASSLPSSTSNASINDDDYVAVSVPSPVSEYHQAVPSSRLGLPFRNRKQDTPRRSQDLLLEPPPRQSSLFPAYQDRHQGHPGLSTQSLPSQVDKQKQRPEPLPLQRPHTSSKKSLFNWSSKQKPSGTKLSDEILPDDASFNLKAFRHIRPDSPSMSQLSAAQQASPSPPLPPPPIPTTTLPGRESAFQVTSRRPRGNETTTTTTSRVTATASTTMTQSQQKMAVAAFLQAARRSATSLSPTDSSPRLSPVRTSFDDRSSAVLSLSASAPEHSTPPRPPRSQPPGTSTPKLGPEVAQKSSFTARAAPVKTSNAFGDSDSDETSEEEDEDADSGVEGIKSSGHSRKRTIRRKQAPLSSPTPVERDSFGSKLGIPHLDLGGSLELNGNGLSDGLFTSSDPVRAWTPPISVPYKSRTETPPPNESTLWTSKAESGNATRESLANSVHSVLTQPKLPPQERSATVGGDFPRPPSSLSMYQNGERPRASLSVGALDVSAKEARASMLLAANTRLSNGSSVMLVESANGASSISRTASPAPTADSTPRPTSRSLNTTFPKTTRPRADSDTSESSSSSSSSDDAPLSQLVPPRRPGTAMSSRSDSSPARRPALLPDSSTFLPQSSSASVVGGRRKPLVDLAAPSSLTGRAIGMPPPQAKEEEMSNARKSRLSVDTGISVSTLRPASNQRVLSSDTASSSSRTYGAAATRPNISSRLQSVATNVTGAPHRHHMSPPTAISNVTPPVPPFLRRESPASSTGDSSSGKAPYTPRDGSRPGSIASASVGAGGRGKLEHGRKPSVTFEDELDGTVRGRGGVDGGKDRVKEKTKVVVAEEKRKERRRSEARAAIELGKVVNGPPPVDPDDELPQVPGTANMMGMQPGGGVWPQMQMQMQMMPTQMQMMPMMSPMGIPVSPMMMGMQPTSFPFPDVSVGTSGVSAPTLTQVSQQQQAQLQSGNDAAFLAAHQQAMAIAKQTFQMAVAQQALAAANDEWERSSAVTGFGGGPPQWGRMMGMGPMFPPAPRSMYAGSMSGGVAWGGTGSVYGGTFGMQGGGVRNSQVELNMPSSSTHLRSGGRQRTKTAPSSQNPPAQPQTSAGRKMPPPSSYKGAR